MPEPIGLRSIPKAGTALLMIALVQILDAPRQTAGDNNISG
jgi:hypothetical protein